MRQKTFSFRFDIDSLADIEVGVPMLMDLSNRLDVKFTFFVNMGRSFNWSTVVRGQGSGGRGFKTKFRNTLWGINPQSAIRIIQRLGLWRTLRTVVFNPDIGLSHTKILFNLLDEGHELGLHGGMDHPLWQWGLDSLDKDEINDLLKPAYNYFVKLFGKPKGFASPGFSYNRFVLELMDDYSFEYASDMEGERPFKPKRYGHLQVPVNVTGPGRIPLIEHLYASGLRDAEIVKRCKVEVEAKVKKNGVAVMYGHPTFEGSLDALEEILVWVKRGGCGVVTMGEIVDSLRKEV